MHRFIHLEAGILQDNSLTNTKAESHPNSRLFLILTFTILRRHQSATRAQRQTSPAPSQGNSTPASRKAAHPAQTAKPAHCTRPEPLSPTDQPCTPLSRHHTQGHARTSSALRIPLHMPGYPPAPPVLFLSQHRHIASPFADQSPTSCRSRVF